MGKEFDSAKAEYFEENENGKYKLVYAYFGSAIYYGQCLEETFSIMLWTDKIFKQGAKTNKEVNDIITALV